MSGRLFLLFLLLLTSLVRAQENNIPIDQWRVHMPYLDMNTVTVAGNKIYCGSSSSMFSFDKEDHSVSIMSKATGMNDIGITKLSYSNSQQTLIIAYSNGNIDLIKNNNISNITDIYRSGISGSKTINHVYTKGKYAYFAGDFGVTLFDLSEREVVESYLSLAPGSASNPVYCTAILDDSIFLATSKGVMTARISQTVNLLDFANWYTYQASDSIDTVGVTQVCSLNDTIYAAVDGKGIYFYHDSTWRKTSVPVSATTTIKSMNFSKGRILACLDTCVYEIFSPYVHNQITHHDIYTPTEAWYDDENNMWISTNGGSLTRYNNGTVENIIPNGPLTNNIFAFSYYNNNIVALSGGYDNLGTKRYNADWFSIFENNTLWSPKRYSYPAIPDSYRDFIAMTYNPANATSYYSTYGDGIVAIKGNDVTLYDTSSPLSVDIATGTSVYAGKTALDKDNKLWIPISGASVADPNLFSLSPDGTWNSYSVAGTGAQSIISVTIDDIGSKWLVAKGAATGLMIYNETLGKQRSLSTTSGNGKLPDPQVNCVTKDKKGVLWIGTNKGMVVCYDPSAILNSGVDLITPIFDGFPILFERQVLSIEVDGGNRKWIGTNDGLWLFNDDATQVLAYYDKDNSPLLSSTVTDIKIHELSGEVFFATPEGIISYRGTSTTGDEKYSDVKVFPNPVKPGFSGLIGISGLDTDAFVKITDVYGNLVYETQAEGGTAVWNAKDYNGRRAASGVYLIFCATEEGDTKLVSKVAVIE